MTFSHTAEILPERVQQRDYRTQRKETPIKNIKALPPFWGIVPLFMLAHFSHHLMTALPVPLTPFIREYFSLSYTQSGLVVSAFTLSYGIAQLPSGWLADRLGPRTMMTIAISGVALVGFFIGITKSYIALIALLVLMGIVGGGYHPSAPPMIARLVNPSLRGRAIGLHMGSGSVAYFLAPLIGAAIATSMGWHSSFILLAIPTFILGIILYILLGRIGDINNSGKLSSTSSTEEVKDTSWLGLSPHLAIFIILSTFTQAVILSVVAFIPLFMTDHFGVDAKTAALSLALLYSAGIWASPLGGYLSDRLGSVKVVISVCFLAGPAIVLLASMPYGFFLALFLLILGTIVFVRAPASVAYIVDRAPEKNRSTILGIYHFSSQESGGVLTPVMGYFIGKLGFFPSFAIAGIFVLIVTLICSLLLLRIR